AKDSAGLGRQFPKPPNREFLREIREGIARSENFDWISGKRSLSALRQYDPPSSHLSQAPTRLRARCPGDGFVALRPGVDPTPDSPNTGLVPKIVQSATLTSVVADSPVSAVPKTQQR